MACDMLDAHVLVSTLVADSITITQIYHDFTVIFMGFQTWVDLEILDMLVFDIRIGMT